MLQDQERELFEEKGISFMFTLDLERDNAPHGRTYKGVERMRKILDFWDDHHVTATVFVTGEVARRFPDLVKEISVTHELGCHMDDHEPLTRTPYDERQFSLPYLRQALQNATAALSGVRKPSCFRAPYLAFSRDVVPLLLQVGYKVSSSVPASHSRGLVVRGELTEVCVSASLFIHPLLRYEVFSLRNLISYGDNLMRGLFDLLILKHTTVPRVPVVFLCHSWDVDEAALRVISNMMEAFPVGNTVYEPLSAFTRRLQQGFITSS